MDTAVFLVTNRCNLRCNHCFIYHPKETRDLPLDVFKKILPELKQYKINHLSLTGGEPLLHNRFEDLLSTLSNEGFNCKIVSNGFFFEEKVDMIKKFKENITRMCFSVEGPAEVHDRIRGEGSFKRVMRAIDLCRQLGIKVTMQVTVNKQNISELRRILHLALKKQVDNFSVNNTIPLLGESNKELGSMALDYKQREHLARRVRALRIFTKGRVTGTASLYHISRRDVCKMFMLNSIAIDFDGNMIFCCNVNQKIAELKTQPAHIISLKTHTLTEGFEALLKKINRIRMSKIKDVLKEDYKSWSECEYCLHKLGYDIGHKE